MQFSKAARFALVVACMAWGPEMASAQQSVDIPLDLNPTGNGFSNYMTVSVGNGAPSEVLLDTGSTGMRFLRSEIGPDVIVTNMVENYGYSSGNEVNGFLGFAPVSFPDASSPLSTPQSQIQWIAIQVVDSVTCKASNPDCPGWQAGQSGVMGVAYDNFQIFNPLAQLGGNLGSGFIMVDDDLANPTAKPMLIVGLTPSNMQGFLFSPLAGTPGGMQPAGLNVWNTKSVYTCFAVNGGSPGCFASVFDSGAGSGSFDTPTSPQQGFVPAGSVVSMTVPNILSFSTVAGTEQWTNIYKYESPHGSTPGFNSGALVYRYYAILFDELTGQIGFSPITNWIFGTYEPASDAALGAPGAGVALGGTLVMPDGFSSDRAIYLISAAGLQSLGSATLGGTLSGFDPLTIEGPGTLNLTGSSLYSGTALVQNGTLLVNGLLPASILLGSGATLGGSGMIASFAAAAGSKVSPGTSIGTLSVVNSAVFGPGSTYEAQLGAPGQSDLIAVGGQAMLAGSVAALPTTGFLPKLGSSYTILTAGGGITGSFSSVTGPAGMFGALDATYPFLAPVLSYSPTAATLAIGRSALPFAAAGITPNESAAGAGADGLAVTSPLTAALALLDRTTAPGAFDALSGEIYPSTQSLLQQQSFQLRDTTNERLRQAFAGTATASDAVASKLAAIPLGTADPANGVAPTVWAEGFGGWDRLAGNSNAAALDGSGGGFLMGIDNPLGKVWRAGVAGGYSSTSFDVAQRSSSGSVSSYDVAVYGGARWGDLGLRLGAGYTWNNISASRSAAFPGFASQLSSSYNAGTAQVYGELGYGLHFGPTTVEPLADLAYVNLASDGFSETGGLGALTASSASFDTTYSVLGARIAHTFDLADGTTLTASGRVGWQHAFGDVTPSTTLTFAGTATAFSVAGVPINQNAAIVEAGIGYSPLPNVTLALHYAGQLAPDARENSLNGTVDIRF